MEVTETVKEQTGKCHLICLARGKITKESLRLDSMGLIEKIWQEKISKEE